MSYRDPILRYPSALLSSALRYLSFRFHHTSFRSISFAFCESVIFFLVSWFMMSSTSDSTASSLPAQHTETPPSQPDSVLATVKHQIDSVTGGAPLSKIPSKVTAVAGEKAHDVKETVVPAAGEALQKAQDQIQSLAGGGTGNGIIGQGRTSSPRNMLNIGYLCSLGENSATTADEHERVDQMSSEQVCDFLRAKHSSTRPPPSTN